MYKRQAPDSEAQIAGLEVALFEMLMGAIGLRLGMAGKMHPSLIHISEPTRPY